MSGTSSEAKIKVELPDLLQEHRTQSLFYSLWGDTPYRHQHVPYQHKCMPYYRQHAYRNYVDRVQRYHDYPMNRYHAHLMNRYHDHPLNRYDPYYNHPYDNLFYGSRWYDYPPSIHRDHGHRLPPITGPPRTKLKAEYGDGYMKPYYLQDPYAGIEPRYQMLFNDELKTLPKYSKYNNYPLKMYY